ncbi:MAG: VTT domain-containing protein [Candidatus Cloacimonetes bacterium]|nr:VTT domain-containing protein [Candidatus Cloacimonadota bacterium]
MSFPLWMLDFIHDYGTIALFITSFIAATIVPASSAAILLAALAAKASPIPALIACSAGNSLGCAVNYWMGYFIGKPLIPKLEKSKSGRKALEYTTKYGTWSLFVSWTPFLGDPLTIAAGIFRVNFLKFSIIVYSLRIVGYIMIALFFIK